MKSIAKYFHLLVGMCMIAIISHVILQGVFQWHVIVSSVIGIFPIYTYLDFRLWDGQDTKPVIRHVAMWLYNITEEWDNT
jgi:hypothetical protein